MWWSTPCCDDAEIPEALSLIRQIYQSGADALIIQDVGLLECNLPPIPLFASTQMHNHTPAACAFPGKSWLPARHSGARTQPARKSARSASRPASNWKPSSTVHCASATAGSAISVTRIGGRSGNRGQCAQPCRQAYSLVDGTDQVLVQNRHLLSIRDLNLTEHLRELVEAGVTSFKIEGRLKDKNYVMNVVSHYRRALDSAGRAAKSSSGHVSTGF